MAKTRIKASRIWERIVQNKDERYHFLEAVPAAQDLGAEGISDLVADFKRFFFIPLDEMYRQCAPDGNGGAKRRCRLIPPYREHFQNRAGFSLLRVGLPLDHKYASPLPVPIPNPPCEESGKEPGLGG